MQSEEVVFKVGSVVRLKSNGPSMTVKEIYSNTGGRVVCIWFDSENMLHSTEQTNHSSTSSLEPFLLSEVSSPDPNKKINPGDVVILESGGQTMTVLEISDWISTCVWFSGDKNIKLEYIPTLALRVV